MSSYNPYTAPRSTTPPLYYKRPEGVPQSYYTVPAQREVYSLAIPSFPTPRMSATAAAPVAPHQQQQQQSMSAPYNVASIFPASAAAAAEAFRPSDNARFGGGTGSTARWSYQQQPRQDEESRRMAQLEAEEAAFAAEEAALKAKKTELLVARRRQEEEQLRLSEGWASLLEREERYYTEPVPDVSQDIAAREHQCAALHEQLMQAESHKSYLDTQLSHYEYVLKDKEAAEKEVARVREGLQGVEQRRRACIARAERFFDVETKRVIEANKAVRKLDVQLKEMTATGPLAQLQCANSASRSQSRCVTFAPADKSVVIDSGRNGSLSTSVSVDPAGRGNTQGLSQEAEEESGSINSGRHQQQSRPTTSKGAQLGGASVCLGLEDDEEGGMGIGGTSVAFSFNNSAQEAIVKRRKVELAV